MPLITMYHPKKAAPGYRKAVIDETEQKFFAELGFLTAAELKEAQMVATITSETKDDTEKIDDKKGSTNAKGTGSK